MRKLFNWLRIVYKISVIHFFKDSLTQTIRICWLLFKLMIPVTIIVKFLTYTGYLYWLAKALAPVMTLVGLPGEAAIVWVSAMCTNLYGGIIAYLSLSHTFPISVAQASVLTGMMLIAHSLPIELKIAQKAGVRLRMMMVLRVASAFLFGIITWYSLKALHLYQEPATILWKADASAQSWVQMLIGEVTSYGEIMLVVFALVVLMKFLKQTNLIRWINLALKPILKLLGMSDHAAPITMIGILMGISYGGGLIISEARSGLLTERDLFVAVALLSICHSLIEDSIIMVMLGGNALIIVLGRFLFALILVKGLMMVYDRVPHPVRLGHFTRPLS